MDTIKLELTRYDLVTISRALSRFIKYEMRVKRNEIPTEAALRVSSLIELEKRLREQYDQFGPLPGLNGKVAAEMMETE